MTLTNVSPLPHVVHPHSYWLSCSFNQSLAMPVACSITHKDLAHLRHSCDDIKTLILVLLMNITVAWCTDGFIQSKHLSMTDIFQFIVYLYRQSNACGHEETRVSITDASLCNVNYLCPSVRLSVTRSCCVNLAAHKLVILVSRSVNIVAKFWLIVGVRSRWDVKNCDARPLSRHSHSCYGSY